MVRVKLCGLMSREDVEMAEAAGADALGFVTEYPVPVPWNLDREQAASLAALASPFVTTVAVVGGPPEEMVRIARRVRPRVLQLHGDESLDHIRQVLEGLKGTGIRVIKALRIEVETGQARFEETDPILAGTALAGSGIAALIVDSKTSSRPAGTGVTLDWDVSARMVKGIDLPLILAGGLTLENVAGAVQKVKPYAVDVITGVEIEPGVKSGEKMRAFVAAAKGIKL
ncbi:MAG: phosphoribosylanthranilate isomerase [bacterium]|nr:phosphoribosylanthranilate isomerase [bacterium]MDT8365416.1 phosphoribosylanthranilate isomerase [bacterium]